VTIYYDLPMYPTVAWGSRTKERWDSRIHYRGNGGRTVCGVRIPRNAPPARNPREYCQRCVHILPTEE